MYIGHIGIVRAARRPARINVISSGRISGSIKCDRPIAPIDITIGHYTARGILAMFDAGSTDTVFCLPDARKKIDADPFDHSFIRGFSGDLDETFMYDASLKLPDNVSLDVGLINVYEGNFSLADIIIGMDIIRNGVLTVDGPKNSFTFEI